MDDVTHQFHEYLSEGVSSVGEYLTILDRLRIIHETAGLIDTKSQRDKRWVEVIRSQTRQAMTLARRAEKEEKTRQLGLDLSDLDEDKKTEK